jgi:hypothetical protein
VLLVIDQIEKNYHNWYNITDILSTNLSAISQSLIHFIGNRHGNKHKTITVS